MQTNVTMPSTTLPHLWKAALGAGIVSMLLGAVVLTWPGRTVLVVAIVFGVYLLVAGVSQVVLALSVRTAWSMRLLPLISGVAAVVLAVLCFLNLQNSLLLLAIWVGVGWVFRGVATVTSALGDRTLPGGPWEVVVGVVSLAAGVVVLASPFASLATLALIVAIWFVVVGMFEVASAFRIRVALRFFDDQSSIQGTEHDKPKAVKPDAVPQVPEVKAASGASATTGEAAT